MEGVEGEEGEEGEDGEDGELWASLTAIFALYMRIDRKGPGSEYLCGVSHPAPLHAHHL